MQNRGVTVALGEMNIARGKPKPWLGGSLPVRNAVGSRPSGNRWPPTSGGRLEVCLLPGGRRTPGYYVGRWRMGDDVWKGKK